MSNAKEIPTYCKWCHKVEITFDQNRKSKSGKLIPIDKSSGLPHECSERPKSNGFERNISFKQAREPIQVEQEVLQLIQLLTSKVKVLIEARQSKQ